MIRLRLIAPLLAVGLLSGGFLVGQVKKDNAKEPIFITKRLPPYYNKLGLSEKQKKEIYKIRARYSAKIEELQQKIVELKEQSATDTENVLTPAQKARLRELVPASKRLPVEKDKEVKPNKGKATEIKKP